ncbi:MAG: HAMP domain-containing sensor histidine kinase [Chthoniobacter sp.]|uniref:sensor histidine kinase n=1 Tax=Chthoniobacter sp. TaxID=2510640 RepID=UPI0032AD8346
MDASRFQLLRTAAHELRNLLNCAQLEIQGLSEQNDEASRAELLPVLARNLHQMNEILTDLLDFSMQAAGRRTLRIALLSSTEFVEELLLAFRTPATAKGLALTGECDLALCNLATDGTKLKQIAVNLLSNAIKYTDRGQVRFWLRAQGEFLWVFGVEDSGPGFDAQVRAQLFDEFYRAQQTADREGTGLGLPIVKRLVEMLGGRIRIESEPGRGSRFEVILPREQYYIEAAAGAALLP